MIHHPTPLILAELAKAGVPNDQLHMAADRIAEAYDDANPDGVDVRIENVSGLGRTVTVGPGHLWRNAGDVADWGRTTCTRCGANIDDDAAAEPCRRGEAPVDMPDGFGGHDGPEGGDAP